MSSRKGPKEVSRAEELSVEMMPKLSSSGISARAAGAPSVAPSAAASATVTAVVVTVLSIVVSLLFDAVRQGVQRSEEHTSELQSLMRNSYAVFCLKKKK